MKTTRYLFISLLMTLMSMNTSAQQRNILHVPDVTTKIGDVQLPVNIENTDEIVGVQFDLALPEGVTAETEGILTNRRDNHEVTVRQLTSGAYRVLIHSEQNHPLRGQQGVVMYLPITIPNTFEEGSEHPLTITNAVLGKATGENVLTEVIAGKIRISKLPDLTVKNFTIDKQTLNPGERFIASWQVENIGEMQTGSGWSEQLSLVSEDGKQSKYITTTYYDGMLNAGGIVSRQVEVMLPSSLGIDGQSRLQVKIVPNSNTGESASTQGNNTQLSNNVITINKVLTLELSPHRIEEGNGRHIALRVNRSGNWTVAETFNITATADSRVSVPANITIPANQSGAVVYFDVNDNDILDNDSIVNIKVTGNSYPEASVKLVIEDNEYPILTLTASKSQVTEGETFQLTVSISHILTTPTKVTLTSEKARRFTFPSQVIIPAGQESATIDVVVVNNDEIELTENVTFRASAGKFGQGECFIDIDDDDMPTLTFTISPKSVSESDGYAALFCVIKRTDNLDKRVTFKLSDDSKGMLTYSTQTIVLEKNKAEVQFNIGVIDNDLVDGNHIVNVTAAVYASSCDCSASNDTKGSMKETVIIIDDDGPTLKIKPAKTTMLEGSEGNVFAISHNIQSDADVTVHVSSDKDDILEYEHELIIPAGQSTANLLVNVKSNDQQDDSNIATFKVEADGYAMGTCWIAITDQTLPDAIVSLYADKTETEAEQTVLLRAVVKNVGHAPLRSTTPVEISFSGRKETIDLKVGKSVAVGDSAVIEYNYGLPALTGSYTFEATVNAAGKVPELIYANNTSEMVGIRLLSPFSVTAKADKDVYKQDESINITGKATGSAGKNAKIDVYFINEGSRQTIGATSDEEGNYSVVWKPQSRLSGHFIVGACYPGAKETEEMDAFDVYGIRAKDNFKTCELSQTDKQSGKIVIINPGNLAQTGLTVTPKAESDNCVFTYDVPASIGAGESVEIVYTVTGNEISEGRDWQQMPLEITTAEGSHLDYTIYYYVHSLKARLQTNQSNINTTMTYGTPREYPVTIKNIGRTETGKITLALPNWIQAVTPSEMASLAQGDSTTIVLRFIPTEAMKLNVRVSGQLGINCENGDGVAIHFNLTPVSEAKGKLTIDVIDEYTYFTQESPHVSKAKVKLKNPSTYEIVAEDETSDDGIFSVDIPEGHYVITVEADKHESYFNTVIVDPGVEKSEEVFLSYKAITYSWDVVETSVEDEYEYETIVKYETRVPKPVVVISLPSERPVVNGIIPVIVTNHGLVNAIDLDMNLSVSNGFSLEFLNDQHLDILHPQQAHVFYAKLKVTNYENGARVNIAKKAVDKDDCLILNANERHKEPCDKYLDYEYSHTSKSWGNCSRGGNGGSSGSGNGGSSGSGGNGGYGPGSPSIGSNTAIDDYYDIQDYIWNTTKDCDDGSGNGSGGSGNESGGSGSGNIGSGNNDGDNPPFVPETPPYENNNCEDVPDLHYTLISNDGHRYEMKGVAADSVSQVMIVFDSKYKSFIPKEDCDWTCHWSLEDDNGKIGKLENTESWDKVVYTAPEDFPSESGSEYLVRASNTYTNGTISYKKTVEIIVVRVPLVLVHGINAHGKLKGKNGKKGTWIGFSQYIKKEMFDKYPIEVTDYESTNCSHFEVNANVVNNSIQRIIQRYLEKPFCIKASKVDLIGHSMGGILSRWHVQFHNGAKDVHKIITLNTPHSGSEIGDFMIKHDLLRTIGTSALGYSDTGAIYDLAVNSEENDEILNKQNMEAMTGIAVHSVSTKVSGLIPKAESVILGLADAGTGWANAIKHLCNLGYWPKYSASRAVLESDLVVSLDSQKGGLESPSNSTYSGSWKSYWHGACAQNDFIWNHLKNLLNCSVNSDYFCKSGFKPVDRSAYDDNTLNQTTDVNANSKGYPRNKISQLTSQDLSIETHIVDDSLFVNINYPDSEGILGKSSVVLFDDETYITDKSDFSVFIPSTIQGEIKLYAMYRIEDTIYTDSAYVYIPKTRATPISIEYCGLSHLVIGEILNPYVICKWDDGSETSVIPDTVIFSDNIINLIGASYVASEIGKANTTFIYNGLKCSASILVFDPEENVISDDDSNSICSSVTLSFKQKMVMTRQAFRGTLTMSNGNEKTAMKDVKMNLEVRDMDGKLATSHEFQINAESLNGFSGELNLGSGWTLAGGGTGVATIMFIPTKYAAPTEPKDYAFGGSFSYTDPYTGLTVTRDLNPVTLTVKPSPELNLLYFMQRDVYGDDPLTEEVEPGKPTEFSLLINNIGNGDATNVRMVTNQPEIIDNQKGLLIDFEILSSQLNGGDKTLPLGGIIPTDFGTIPAHSQAYAQWWFQSSLLGHFIEYDVQATHVTSYGNPDLSLMNDVTIHELIHSIKVDDGKVTGFVVNDFIDAEDTPDMVYFTDGTTAEVVVADNATWERQSDTEYLLTINPSQPGWNYGYLTDPTYGSTVLASIRKQDDGTEINLRNFWQTDRTLRDGKDWLYENRIHFVDEFTTKSPVTYMLTFEPRPDTELQVVSFEDVPEEGVVLHEPLQTVTVTFNKAINAETFTREDITLNCQGKRLEGQIGITQVSDTKFTLDLSQLTASNGYYVLTVQTAGITDSEGFNGTASKSAAWVQLTEATTLELSFYEAEVPYDDRYDFTEPRVKTNSLAIPTFTSTNPLVASVDSITGKVTINAVGTTQVNVSIEETSISNAARTAYRLTVLQPEGSSEAPAGIETVSITIPEGQTMTTYCSPWPIDFSGATDNCRAYRATIYQDNVVVCVEVTDTIMGGVGLLIAGKPGTHTFPVRSSFYVPEENLFVGTLAPTYIEEMTGEKTNFGLKVNKFVPLKTEVVMANKAYLPIKMENGMDEITIELKGNGLSIVTENPKEDVWYHISGIKVNRPSTKGIYIQNGRKIVVK